MTSNTIALPLGDEASKQEVLHRWPVGSGTDLEIMRAYGAWLADSHFIDRWRSGHEPDPDRVQLLNDLLNEHRFFSSVFINELVARGHSPKAANLLLQEAYNDVKNAGQAQNPASEEGEKFPYIVLIVPALTFQASNCKIYCTEDDDRAKRHKNQMLEFYREDPGAWFEIGLMNARGEIVCLDAPVQVWNDLRANEPNMAGTYTRYVLGFPWKEQVAIEQAQAPKRNRPAGG